ncbi:MAG: prephenate dehydratase [Gemmatimonadaceae bacterium]
MTRVAFQGELGAFSEQAVVQLWPDGAEPVPMRDFIDVARAVQRGGVDFGVLPIENTLAGSVIGTYDALFACDALHVVSETVVAIHHCVLALPGASLDSLRVVSSHPVALAQCERFFRAHPHLVARATYDTAGAAREVAERGDSAAGAIAGRPAAERYGLEIVAADVEDRPDNQTRFVAIAGSPRSPATGTAARSIVVLTTDNVPGALLRVLEPLAEHGINMSKLESRPTGEPWAYRFFLELEHAAGDEAIARALDAVQRVSRSFRLLGTVAAWGGPTPLSH